MAIRGFYDTMSLDGKKYWDRDLVAETVRELNQLGISPDIRVRISPEDYRFEDVGKFSPYAGPFRYPNVWGDQNPTLATDKILIKPDWPEEEIEEMKHHCKNASPRSIRFMDERLFGDRIERYLTFFRDKGLKVNSLGFFNEINSTCGNADILVRRKAYKAYERGFAPKAAARHQASTDKYAKLLATVFDRLDKSPTLSGYFNELKIVSFPAALKAADADHYGRELKLLTNKIHIKRYYDSFRHTRTQRGDTVYDRLHAISFNTYPKVKARSKKPAKAIDKQLGKVVNFVRQYAPDKPLWINEFGFHQFYNGRSLKGKRRPGQQRFENYRYFLSSLIDNPEYKVEQAMIFAWNNRRNPLVVPSLPGKVSTAGEGLLLPEAEILRYSR